MISVFDEWLINDFGEIFVQIFEQCVSGWIGQPPKLCVFSETCGRVVVMEYNGDVYSCDHFVYPEYKQGNIKETRLEELINSAQQIEFGNNKRDKLPEKCLNCDNLFICHGGCPKNRLEEIEKGKKLNYLCEGYRQFFNYIDPYMEEIATRIKKR
ncbi:MAG: SPASM domain-containing protein [bacterium]